jgi:hypothetical protein
MTKYRKRPKRMKDGELSVSYGYTREQGEDVYITNGPGCPKSDGHLMHFWFNCLKPPGTFLHPEEGPTLVEDLKSRGYDITTLRFTIQKLKASK